MADDKTAKEGLSNVQSAKPARTTRKRKTLHQRINELETEISSLKQIIFATIPPNQPQFHDASDMVASTWCYPLSSSRPVNTFLPSDLQSTNLY